MKKMKRPPLNKGESWFDSHCQRWRRHQARQAWWRLWEERGDTEIAIARQVALRQRALVRDILEISKLMSEC